MMEFSVWCYSVQTEADYLTDYSFFTLGHVSGSEVQRPGYVAGLGFCKSISTEVKTFIKTLGILVFYLIV